MSAGKLVANCSNGESSKFRAIFGILCKKFRSLCRNRIESDTYDHKAVLSSRGIGNADQAFSSKTVAKRHHTDVTHPVIEFSDDVLRPRECMELTPARSDW